MADENEGVRKRIGWSETEVRVWSGLLKEEIIKPKNLEVAGFEAYYSPAPQRAAAESPSGQRKEPDGIILKPFDDWAVGYYTLSAKDGIVTKHSILMDGTLSSKVLNTDETTRGAAVAWFFKEIERMGLKSPKDFIKMRDDLLKKYPVTAISGIKIS